MASVNDLVIPFSGCLEAAEIIQQKASPDMPIVGDRNWAAAAVGAYLDRAIYYPARGEYGTFSHQDAKTRLAPVPPEVLTQSIRDVMAASKSDVILLVDYPLSLGGDQVELLGAVNRCVIPDEQFMVFRVKYQGPR
jgi:hypothetical protein